MNKFKYLNIIFLFLLLNIQSSAYNQEEIKITMVCKNKPLRQIFEEFADKYKMGFVFRDEVVNNLMITCHIDNVDFEKAIQLILSIVNLQYEKLSGEIYVISPIKSDDTQIIYKPLIIGNETLSNDTITHPENLQSVKNNQIKRRYDNFKPSRTIQYTHILNYPIPEEPIIYEWYNENYNLSLDNGQSHFKSVSNFHNPSVIENDWLNQVNLVPGFSSIGSPSQYLKSTCQMHNMQSIYWDDILIFHPFHGYGLSGIVPASMISEMKSIYDGSALLKLKSVSDPKNKMLVVLDPLQTHGQIHADLTPDLTATVSAIRSNFNLVSMELSDVISKYQFARHSNVLSNSSIEAPINYYDIAGHLNYRFNNDVFKLGFLHSNDQINKAKYLSNNQLNREDFSNTGFSITYFKNWGNRINTELVINHSGFENISKFQEYNYSNIHYAELDKISTNNIKFETHYSVHPHWNLSAIVCQTYSHFKNIWCADDNEFFRKETSFNLSTLTMGSRWSSNSVSMTTQLEAQYVSNRDQVYLHPNIQFAYTNPNLIRFECGYHETMSCYQQITNQYLSNIPKLNQYHWIPINSLQNPNIERNLYFGINWNDNLYEYYLKPFVSYSNHLVCLRPYNPLLDLHDWENNWYDQFNMGAGYLYGVDFNLLKKTGQLSGWINLNLSQKKVKGLCQNKQYITPENYRTIQIKVYGLYQHKWFNFSANYIIASGATFYRTTPEVQTNQIGIHYWGTQTYDDLQTLPYYHRMDFQVVAPIQLKRHTIELGANVINVFNTKNAIGPYVWQLKDDNQVSIQLFKNSTERLLSLFLKWKF